MTSKIARKLHELLSEETNVAKKNALLVEIDQIVDEFGEEVKHYIEGQLEKIAPGNAEAIEATLWLESTGKWETIRKRGGILRRHLQTLVKKREQILKGNDKQKLLETDLQTVLVNLLYCCNFAGFMKKKYSIKEKWTKIVQRKLILNESKNRCTQNLISMSDSLRKPTFFKTFQGSK